MVPKYLSPFIDRTPDPQELWSQTSTLGQNGNLNPSLSGSRTFRDSLWPNRQNKFLIHRKPSVKWSFCDNCLTEVN